MNREQKIAWFSLIMVTLAFGLSLISVGVLYFGYGLPMRRAAGGFGFIGIMGFSALAPLLFKKDKGKVKLDERDLLMKILCSAAILVQYGRGNKGEES